MRSGTKLSQFLRLFLPTLLSPVKIAFATSRIVYKSTSSRIVVSLYSREISETQLQ